MQLMLDKVGSEAGQDGGNHLAGEAKGSSGIADRWSYAIRLGLAVAAVCAAWFIMTSAWPAELTGRAFADVATGSLPGRMGTLIASLR